MEAGASPAPLKPWERAGKLPNAAPVPAVGVVSAVGPGPVVNSPAVASSGGAISSLGPTAASKDSSTAVQQGATVSGAHGASGSDNTANVTSASTALRGTSTYPGSMYSSSYGTGYGSGMYGGGMMGGGMYGGSSMYGGGMYGGMAGRPAGPESEFFKPKQAVVEGERGKVSEFADAHAVVLNTLHDYGDSLWNLSQRVLTWLSQLRKRFRSVKEFSAGAHRAAPLSAVLIALYMLVLARTAAARRQRRLRWEMLYHMSAFPPS
eukprot:TRINITY_DN23584_c0_g2_i1.p1 TRINITY_DN23584_c0_g2~~TRINITY_DN23584_c0_g2_i1.p1  ORF type:complete len:264 (+),score=26.77 TRINITY_DN23584_c0_g2_i1:61-852(+)